MVAWQVMVDRHLTLEQRVQMAAHQQAHIVRMEQRMWLLRQEQAWRHERQLCQLRLRLRRRLADHCERQRKWETRQLLLVRVSYHSYFCNTSGCIMCSTDVAVADKLGLAMQ